MNEALKAIADEVMDDLDDRMGMLDGVDDETRDEIRDSIAELIAANLSALQEARPVAWNAAVIDAAKAAEYVFRDSCDHTMQAIEYMQAKMLSAQPAQQDARDAWQPIETAPKDGTRILIGCPESEFHCAESTVGWWQEAEEDGVDYMGADAGFVDFEFQVFGPGRSFGNPMRQYAPTQPTHWMPLPAAPDAALAAAKEKQ